jgi:membrane protein CcdC involved in cytochrome C biogenesis
MAQWYNEVKKRRGGIHMNISIASHMHAVSLIGSLGAALMVIWLRSRGRKKPVRVMQIIMPPIGMSSGFLMFMAPMMRIPFLWAIEAFALGALIFAYPLIRTSRFHISKGDIYLYRSKAFIWILILLLMLRLALHEYIQEYLTIFQTAAIFFILAFGMLLPWRIAMYVTFRKIQASMED